MGNITSIPSATLNDLRAKTPCGNPYAPRLFKLFDTDKSGGVSFVELCLGLSSYRRTQSTLEGRVDFLLKLHDVDSDGKLSRAEVEDMVALPRGPAFDHKQLGLVVDLMMATYDKDNDGALSKRELSELVNASAISKET
eukprot:jgi/Mesen1/8835/ME000053S08238